MLLVVNRHLCKEDPFVTSKYSPPSLVAQLVWEGPSGKDRLYLTCFLG